MTPIQHSYSHFLPSDGHLDQVYIHPSPSNRASLSTWANPFHPCQGGKHGCDHQHSHHPQQEVNEQILGGGDHLLIGLVSENKWSNFGGSAQESSQPASPPTTMDDEIMDKKSMSEEIGGPSIKDSSKWMPCKIRFTRKVTRSNGLVANNSSTTMPKLQDGQQKPFADANTSSSGGGGGGGNDDSWYNNFTFTTNHHHSVTNIGAVRVCSDCNTTKTPLWRSGPRGPKSLCNACGIRRIRKARRAMASAAFTDGFIPTIAVPASKENRPDNEPCTDSFKKRYRLVDSAQQKLQLEEFTTSLSKNKAFHRVFPQEEKEAAVLLMALSWGLIYG